MIIDCFTYNGECDILDIRLNILYDKVEQFIIVEAPTTFSGKPKPLYFERDRDKFKPFLDKIKYFVIDENYTEEEIEFAQRSPNTQGASHWTREFLQKEAIKKALTHLKDEDIVYIGDVDEIWEEYTPDKPTKLKLKVYTYFLNNRSTEQFWGTLVGYWKDIKNECLNHLRTNAQRTEDYNGWHFTSMGGYEEVKRKLSDSYTRESYWTEGVEAHLEKNIHNIQDFLGRDFKYSIDIHSLPCYIQENKVKYGHLMRSDGEH